jgi:hypothetical protein
MRGGRGGNAPPPYSREAPAIKEADEGGVHKLVVGVDFGTTYTGMSSQARETHCSSTNMRAGVSWVSTEGAHSKTVDDVHCIRDWYCSITSPLHLTLR